MLTCVALFQRPPAATAATGGNELSEGGSAAEEGEEELDEGGSNSDDSSLYIVARCPWGISFMYLGCTLNSCLCVLNFVVL